MKQVLFLSLALLASSQIRAQNKDCKFTTVKAANGQHFSVVQTPSRLGNFLIGKDGGKITLVYNTKALISMFATDTKNVATLKIDSAQFLFTDNTVIALKTVASYGTLPNVNNALKPQLTDVKYSVILEPGSKAETLFKQTKLKTFVIHSEKDGQYADMLNEKQQDKLLQAFTCLQ